MRPLDVTSPYNPSLIWGRGHVEIDLVGTEEAGGHAYFMRSMCRVGWGKLGLPRLCPQSTWSNPSFCDYLWLVDVRTVKCSVRLIWGGNLVITSHYLPPVWGSGSGPTQWSGHIGQGRIVQEFSLGGTLAWHLSTCLPLWRTIKCFFKKVQNLIIIFCSILLLQSSWLFIYKIGPQSLSCRYACIFFIHFVGWGDFVHIFLQVYRLCSPCDTHRHSLSSIYIPRGRLFQFETTL